MCPGRYRCPRPPLIREYNFTTNQVVKIRALGLTPYFWKFCFYGVPILERKIRKHGSFLANQSNKNVPINKKIGIPTIKALAISIGSLRSPKNKGVGYFLSERPYRCSNFFLISLMSAFSSFISLSVANAGSPPFHTFFCRARSEHPQRISMNKAEQNRIVFMICTPWILIVLMKRPQTLLMV